MGAGRVRRLVAGVTCVLALAATALPLTEVVQLPPSYEASSVPGNAAWLDEVDPTLRAWVTDAAAVVPAEFPGRGGGVVIAHGVRFDTAAHARTAWEAIRAAQGERYDVEGFEDVHALRDPLIAGTALVDYHRLVGTDIIVVQLRVDGPDLVSAEAEDVLAWHVRHTGGGAVAGRVVALAVVALALTSMVLVVVRERRSW